ncbi:MAG: sigma-70 family RNA polymerase sigma factor, partial [Firmicutes bacterium]|nr:sigma-70 family RNA polymerase sigma factor [Bacillota bacterium]
TAGFCIIENRERDSQPKEMRYAEEVDVVSAYLNDIGKHKTLSYEETIGLAKKVQAGDTQAKDALFKANLRLVVYWARKYASRRMDGTSLTNQELLDHIQQGNLGLMRAVEKFDPSKGFTFSTYASHWINSKIRRGIDDSSRTVRIPANTADAIRKVSKAEGAYEKINRHKPTYEELAEQTGYSVEKITAIMQWRQYSISSFNSAFSDDGDRTLEDITPSGIGEPQQIYDNMASLRAQQQKIYNAFNNALPALLKSQAMCFALRFGISGGKRHGFKEIAQITGYTYNSCRELSRQARQIIQAVNSPEHPRHTELTQLIEFRKGRQEVINSISSKLYAINDIELMAIGYAFLPNAKNKSILEIAKGLEKASGRRIRSSDDVAKLLGLSNKDNQIGRLIQQALIKIKNTKDTLHQKDNWQLLLPHNQQTYQKVAELFKANNDVAVVQATGTGKQFLTLKLMADNPDKKFLYISTTYYINQQLRKNIFEYGFKEKLAHNDYAIYQNFLHLRTAEDKQFNKLSQKKYDYIVFDEFHHIGAPEWGLGVLKLKEIFPNAKTFGTSATPQRYIDGRDMAEELFDQNVIKGPDLAQAVADGLLSFPQYITSVYDVLSGTTLGAFNTQIEKAQKKIDAIYDIETKKQYQELLGIAKRKVEDGLGVQEIFKKHITKPDGKYIVFCQDMAHQQIVREKMASLMKSVTTKTEHYTINSRIDTPENFETIENFEKNKSGSMKLIYVIDMLNEGLHIDGIDGVIMFRPTQSRTVYEQQLGRALSAGNKTARPVVFDLVNNADSALDCVAFVERIRELRKKQRTNHSKTNMIEQSYKSVNLEEQGNDVDELTFFIHDQVRDFVKMFNQLKPDANNLNWHQRFKQFADFCNTNKRLPKWKEVDEDDNKVASWYWGQTGAIRENRLSKEKLKLMQPYLEMRPEKKIDNWDQQFAKLDAFVKEHGRLPIGGKNRGEEYELYRWFKQQQATDKKRERRTLRKEILKPFFDLHIPTDDRWREKCDQFIEYYNKLGRIPTEQKNKKPDEQDLTEHRFGQWFRQQREYYNKKILPQERVKRLQPYFDKFTENTMTFEKYCDVLKNFVEEKKDLPTTRCGVDYVGDIDIGRWWGSQGFLKRVDENYQTKTQGSNTISLEELLKRKEALMPYFNMRWNKNYNQIINECIANDSIYLGDNVNLLYWLKTQKAALATGELPPEQADKITQLLSIQWQRKMNCPRKQNNQLNGYFCFFI